jgi:biopolymer transport protein ExbB/TolQ
MDMTMTETKRLHYFASALGLSCVFLFLAWALLPQSQLFTILFGQGTDSYPFTMHNLMWIVLFVGFAELLYRFHVTINNQKQLASHLLPEDDHTILTAKDLGPYYQKLKAQAHLPMFLPKLVLRVVTQFQTSKSVEQAQNLLNASLELVQHEIDLKYSMARYIMWLIPTLGFIGTVLGISAALVHAGSVSPQDENLLTEVTLQLGVAFHTTLLALFMSGVLMFILHVIQSMEERVLNQAGQYCLDNLINRLYNEKEHDAG